MPAKLSRNERVQLIFMYGVPGATNRSVAEAFNRRNPNRSPIHQVTVGRLIKRFSETGSVADRPEGGEEELQLVRKVHLWSWSIFVTVRRNPRES